jgi:hypothetical protein
MERRGELSCVYTKDLSRAGIVLLHAEQIFPCEYISVHLASGRTLRAEVRRCRRLQRYCYECGARIVGADARD